MAMSPRLLRPKASGFRYASLRTGLAAYWPMNETVSSGDVAAKDESGRGNDLTSNNSVLSDAGKIENARVLVAANSEYFSIPSNADVQFGNRDWSLALWFNATTWSGQLVAKDSASGRELECALTTADGQNRLRPYFFLSNGGAIDAFVGTGAGLATGQWNFLAFRHIHATGVITARVNTTTATISRPSGLSWATTDTAFTIGRREYTGFFGYHSGKVDECARWNRALSDDELDQLYNDGNGINLGQRT